MPSSGRSDVVNADRHLFVIFGATGDLTSRKLLPSLYRVVNENGVADRASILGVSPTAMSDGDFREVARRSLDAADLEDSEADRWCDGRVFHHAVPRDAATFHHLAERIREIESSLNLPGNRIFYLALPPAAFPSVIQRLGASELNKSEGWTRLVIEKPFGHDLESAQELNEVVHQHFAEDQVYRIDHYLGKETVQNLLTFRFANPIFETTWNRDRLEAVEITVAEDLGVGSRAGYYEHAGVLRDMVQNHLTQLMTLVAMEAPSGFSADAIRNEKVQVLESIHGIDPDHVVFGQYTAGTVDGKPVPGYVEEDGVAPDSTTPTFVGMKIAIDTWRWQGVPFFLRTGKRLPRRTTQVAITYKPAPVCIFHGIHDDCPIKPNVIVLTLQPDEGFEVRFEVKTPGDLGVVSKPMHFDYEAEFEKVPDAYQTLIFDVIRGDQTLFVRSDEVEASWRLYTPLFERHFRIHPYEAGTWGPAATNETLRLWTDEWTMRG
jgi:glucose-6-phosphate 1-dehydrogenase